MHLSGRLVLLLILSCLSLSQDYFLLGAAAVLPQKVVDAYSALGFDKAAFVQTIQLQGNGSTNIRGEGFLPSEVDPWTTDTSRTFFYTYSSNATDYLKVRVEEIKRSLYGPFVASGYEILANNTGFYNGTENIMAGTKIVGSVSSVRLQHQQAEYTRMDPLFFRRIFNDPNSIVDGSDNVTIDGLTYSEFRYGDHWIYINQANNFPEIFRLKISDIIQGDSFWELRLTNYQTYGDIKIATNWTISIRKAVATASPILLRVMQVNSVSLNATIDPSLYEFMSNDTHIPVTAPYSARVFTRLIASLARDLHSDPVASTTVVKQGLLVLVMNSYYNFFLVAMSDYVIAIDAPYGAYQEAVRIAGEQFPGKPIKKFIIHHHRVDHLYDARYFAASDSMEQIYVSAWDVAFFHSVFFSPHTFDNDALQAKENLSEGMIVAVNTTLSPATVVEISDEAITRRVWIQNIVDETFSQGMMFTFLPDDKVAFVTDLWDPPRSPLWPVSNFIKTWQARNYDSSAIVCGGHGGCAPFTTLLRLKNVTDTYVPPQPQLSEGYISSPDEVSSAFLPKSEFWTVSLFSWLILVIGQQRSSAIC